MSQLNFQPLYYSLLLIIAFFITGCSTTQTSSVTFPLEQTSEQRAAQLLALQQWEITGKIAFMTKKSRNRVNLHWQLNEQKQEQQLNLSTYLGINVLKLNSNQGIHQVSVDGKTYQSDNLDQLIYQLTGFTLPTQALTYWLKGLPYQDSDSVIIDEKTQLPTRLISTFNSPSSFGQSHWEVNYTHYQTINHYSLAKKFTIKHGDLLIKIVIDNWST